jgi:endonuclease YncB( thermonuclease family)
VAARELDESCNPGHPCPTATGAEAQATLERLAMDRRLQCEATGGSYGRVTAWCWREDGVELNCAMVESGKALRWAQYDRRNRLCAR